jgi:TonB-dependent receptor
MTKHLKYSIFFLVVSELFTIQAFGQTDQTQEIIIESSKVSDSEKSVIIQKEAANFVNVISAEEIKQIPSFNPADVVRNLPGVSEAHDTGEARYVYIRGLDADYNSTTLDGIKLLPGAQGSPSNGSGGRAVAFDSIPTGLIDSITVTKTLRPDQDAEAIGGTIEMTTKSMPLNGKDMFFDGRLGTGYESLRGTPLFEGSFSMGFRFGAGSENKEVNTLNSFSDKPFSLILSGSLSQDKRGIDDLEPTPNVGGSPAVIDPWDQRYYDYTRTRHGYGINLTYQPSANDTYYVKAFDTGYIEKKSDNIVTPNSDSSASAVGKGYFTSPLSTPIFQHALNDHQEQINNKVLTIGGKNVFDEKTLDYYASFAQGKYTVDYDYNSKFQYTGPTIGTNLTYSNGGVGGTPIYNLGSIVTPGNYANPANYTLSKSTLATESSTDQQYSTGVNLKSIVSIGNFETESVKFGLNGRFRGKDTQFGSYTAANIPNETLAGFTNGQIPSFYNDQYNNGPMIQAGLVQNNLNYVVNPMKQALQYQHNTENVYAGYGQYEFKQGHWSVLGGVRYEYTATSIFANGQDINGNLKPNDSSNSYGNFFPSIQGKYLLEKDTYVRFAYSTGIARPTFNQLNPAASPSSDAGSIYYVSNGDPSLKPTTSNSFDLSLEKYLSKGGVISIGVFDKELANVIAPRTTTYLNGYNQNGTLVPAGNTVYATTFSNIGSTSRVNGLEFNYVQKFDQLLKGPLGGLGTAVNMTLVNSKFEQNPGELSTLPGTSKNIANASVFYEKYGYFARVGVNYASASLYSTGGNVANNIYYDARTFMDASMGYRFNEHYQIYVSASNILNTPLSYYQGEPSQLIQREYYGPTYRAGLNVSF